MRLARTLAATAIAAALVAAPIVATTATATPAPKAPKAKFVISALTLNGPRIVDASTADRSIKFRVQVKDFDKKFDPTSVKVVVVKRTLAGDSVSSFVATTRLVGKSRVVSNWRGSIAIAKGSPGATYCLTLVKIADSSTLTVDTTAMAKGLRGRDCFTVT